MEKFMDFVNGVLPDQGDPFMNLLVFFLVVFGGLYVFFQVIFYLTRERPVEEKKEKVVKDKKNREEKPKPQEEKPKPVAKIKVIKVKPAEKDKIIVKDKEGDSLVFLEREQPQEEPNPYYRNDNCQSYIIGNTTKGQIYDYGDNYMYNYYNDGKTSQYIGNNTSFEQDELNKAYDNSNLDKVSEELKTQTDSIVNQYTDLPTELKRYILYKMFISEIK